MRQTDVGAHAQATGGCSGGTSQALRGTTRACGGSWCCGDESRSRMRLGIHEF